LAVSLLRWRFIAHETIYRRLFIQARGVLKRRADSAPAVRRSRNLGLADSPEGQIFDASPSGKEPAEIEDRSIPGHSEVDLLGGIKNSHMASGSREIPS
jgi:IS30 family transposase